MIPARSYVFELDSVAFRYAEVPALQDVTLKIAQGERLVLSGANGSGKSTLLHLLAGVAFPTSGSVSFEGHPLTETLLQTSDFAFDFRRRVALVFQNPDIQLFNASVFDEVAFGPLQLRWPRSQIIDRVNATLAAFQIEHLKNRAPHRLSGGEKKRVALASVLVLDPEILLLDEPTAGLDPASQNWIIDFLVDCRGSKTVITSTHDLHILEIVGDRCVILQDGRTVADGTPAAILSDEKLLRKTQLLHSHRHRHSSGITHSHPHWHSGHEHRHEH